MLKLIHLADQLTLFTGKTLRWLTLLLVVLVCLTVVLRYFFAIPSIALQEVTLYTHATLFMAGMAYTWQQGAHVSVDVFSKRWSAARLRRMKQAGILFLLLPFCIFLLYSSASYVGLSWAIGERSEETGGLPLVYLLKTLMLIMPVLLIIQAAAEFGKTCYPATPQDLETSHG